MAAALHQPAPEKPFTVAWVPDRGVSGLRVSLLDDQLFGRLMLSLGQRGPLRLGPFEMKLVSARATADSGSPWAGFETYEELRSRGEHDVHLKTTFEFRTPCSFRVGDLDLPLPVPRLLFNGYRRKWRAFSHLGLPGGFEARDDLEELIERHVGVSWAEVRTVPHVFGGHSTVGFVGHVRLALVGKTPPALAPALAILSRFAPYCGTGKKTTQGMGLTRVIPQPAARQRGEDTPE
jgi:CRISPR-associated endoribonuclease Cas6